jgi:hypothetical protein
MTHVPPHIAELILATVPDADGKIHLPHPTKAITVQGPISLAAFLYGLAACKTLTVRRAA